MGPRGPALRVQFDTFELDEVDARLRRDGTPVALAPKAFAVLCTLVRQPGVLVTKSDLLDAVWGHQHVSESVLKTIVSELRAALADDAKQPRYIETASRRGYRFIGTATSSPVGPTRPRAPHLIGRESALAKLREAWRRAQSGERQLVWIAGEAGVGKTSLIQSFISELTPNTATYGQCVEHYGTGEPYLPLLEAIRELCRREPALLREMRAVAPTWLVQMPWFVNESERADLIREVAGAHQDRMVREMRELMDRYTVARPLVFVLEDLHWSDHGTLRMMEHFARRPREVRLLWIASFRLTQVIAEDHPLRELRQELRLHRMCEEILLEPFSESEVGAYMQERLGGSSVPEDFVRRLHAHTEGLPLFVANVADNFIAQSAGDRAAMDAWLAASATAPLPVPDSLAGVIEKQIGRLPADTQALLEAASVCGMDFRAGIVAAMLDRDVSWVSEQCNALVKRQFWLRHVDIVELPNGEFDTRYAFLHAIYQHVFYQRLLLPQRVQLHRRAARTLEAMARTAQAVMPAELASHHERGHQFLQALRYYATAAELAIGHFAPMEAINITGRALKLLNRCPEGEPRMEAELTLMHKHGLACAQVRGIGASETLAAFERARVLCDALPETPGRALLLNGMGLTKCLRGEFAESRTFAERVLACSERYGDLVLRTCGMLLRGILQALQAEHDAARASFEQGIAACLEAGNRVTVTQFVVDPLVALRTNYAVPLMYLGLADQAREQIASATARAQQVGQPMAVMLSLWVGGMIELRAGDPQNVARLARSLSQVVNENMLTQGSGPALWLGGWAEARLGSPRDGFARLREGYDAYARLGMYAGTTEALVCATEALLLAGDLEGAQRQLDEGLELARRIHEHVELPGFMVMRGRIALARGDVAAARASMCEALAESRTRRSPYHELRALIALCDLPGAERSDLESLAAVYATLSETHRLPAFRRAAEILAR